MNKQPFYHRVEAVLFTATRPVSEEEFCAALESSLKKCGLVKGSVEIEPARDDKNDCLVSGMSWEAGDPSDLL